MTREEGLIEALKTLHRIGGAFKLREMYAREKAVRGSKFVEMLSKKQMTDEEIMVLAFDAWEKIHNEVEPRIPGTSIFHCEVPE